MNGIELSRAYYEKYGKPMLTEQFPDLLGYIAVGFTGSGSEHYGFDDEVSRDHDFEPGFMIFLPDEELVDRKTAFRLEKAYLKLPKEFMGVKRQNIAPVGGNRNGVFRISEYYTKVIGDPDAELTLRAWLHLPDYALAEAVNGEIYYDGYGRVSSIRERLIQMPEDIRLKRLAGSLLIMAQSGQYNFTRCLKHGESEAAQFAIAEYVNAAMKAVFLLFDRYMPYYKWSFRALRQIFGIGDLAEDLSFLLLGNSGDENIVREKTLRIEKTASFVIERLKERGISNVDSTDLEKHAYEVNDRIKDPVIRNMHILETV